MSLENSTDVPDVVEPTETQTEAAEEAAATVAPAEDGPVDLDADPTFDEVVSLDEEAPEADPEEEPEAKTEEEGESEEAVAEMVEFNFGGNKLEVDKAELEKFPELESKIQEFSDSTWRDYTKGKQAVAEEAKAIATEREAVARLTTLNGDALQTYSTGLQVRSEIEQLSQVDMNALWQSNPDQARQVTDRLAQKNAEFDQIANLLGQQETALDDAQQSEIARRGEAGVALLDKKIKDFSTTHAPEVVKYAVENYGMDQAEADKWSLNPTVTEMAYKAMMYDRMQAAPKKAKATPAQAKPMKALKAKGNAKGQSSDPSFKELGKILGIKA